MSSILKRFSKYLHSIKYPDERSSWNIAGIIKGKNAFYKFDVRNMKKEGDKVFQNGYLKTEAEKMVLEFIDYWVILDIEELNNYITTNKLKDVYLENLLSELTWNIILTKEA